ncbi:hypothetical protein A9K55_005539 [Cordyceps militaris]|uniref:Mating-type switching protein swi10 n=1 Tax=Cordyceps militaris TaxID=73501 RepID=A0A2H4SAI5_CORMI|nr:hypothetical protein A9K55_005539 [Cordyceps militaris]
MHHRQRLSLHIPGSPPGALPEATYTPSSDRRRSLISLPDSLSRRPLDNTNPSPRKPSRTKLQRFWPGARSPTAHGPAKDHTATHDLSTLILLAGEQMGMLADPRRKTASWPPAPPRPDDPILQRDLETTLPASATALAQRGSSRSIQRKPLPANAVPRRVPAPCRAPPPPPIPELFAVDYRSEDVAHSPPVTPPFASTVRRRAKTPVHRIGQLEAAAAARKTGTHHRGNMEGINRMSSVSTIAREYRALAVYEDTDVPDVPRTDPLHLRRQDSAELPTAHNTEALLLGASYRGHYRTSSSPSADGTLLGSDGSSCPSLTRASSPPADDDDEPPAPASLRFQIGLELLTRELSTAFADQSGHQRKTGSASAGLQIWVMIEAYERLREQLVLTEDNRQAQEAIESWICALRALHGTVASEVAGDESDYENE